MNDHNLDDLIIGDPVPNSKKSKTFLTIIALLIVILIVGMIVWALLFGSSDTDLATDTQTAAAPTHTLDPSLTPLDTTQNDLPVLTPDPVEEPVSISEEPAPKSTSTPEPLTPNVAKPTKPALPLTHNPSKKSPQPASPPKPVKNLTTKPVAHSAASATPHNGQLIKNADKTIYYIQVGAFKRDPSPRFMQKLKKAGFTFITKTTKGIRRVRVGPYDSYNEAKAALPVVKKKIGVNGMIVKF
jgi:DedD protein